ncbi:MAG: hypothetical protein HY814_08125 [Candidatus Riflebacteria bacterium]|nr:hypothetical protein [Candidatus Riflebacteria bacterium]
MQTKARSGIEETARQIRQSLSGAASRLHRVVARMELLAEVLGRGAAPVPVVIPVQSQAQAVRRRW